MDGAIKMMILEHPATAARQVGGTEGKEAVIEEIEVAIEKIAGREVWVAGMERRGGAATTAGRGATSGTAVVGSSMEED